MRPLRALWERPLLLIWVAPLLWAGNVVWARALGPSVPPVTLALARWAVAFAALAPFVAAEAWRQRALLRRHWLLLLLCGAFGVAGYNALVYLALLSVPATSVAFINATMPLLVPLAALALGVERPRLQTLGGILLSFLGVGWIVARGDPGSLSLAGHGSGELLVLLAGANYALYSVLLRRAPPALPPLVFLAATMAAGLLVLAPFSAWELAEGARIPLGLEPLLAILYIGLFASLLAFILWGRCVSTLGPTVTGASFHLVALFTAALAWALLGEPIRGYHLVGIGLILGGFVLAARVKARPAR